MPVIPVWTYWDADVRPKCVEMCIASWKEYLSPKRFRVVVLSRKTMDNYNIIKPKRFNALGPAAQSDVIRLSLLYHHGGIWLDASVLLTAPIDWIMSELPFCGVPAPWGLPYLENWALYAPNPRNALILRWLQTMNSIFDGNLRIENSCSLEKNYFTAYEAFCYLRRVDQAFNDTYMLNRARAHELSPRYSFYIPFRPHTDLVKFTFGGRMLYKFRHVLSAGLAALVGVSVLAIIKYKPNRNRAGA